MPEKFDIILRIRERRKTNRVIFEISDAQALKLLPRWIREKEVNIRIAPPKGERPSMRKILRQGK